MSPPTKGRSNSTKQISAIDPYVSDQLWGMGPPAPGSPTTDPHLLTITVPQPEQSTLAMGAGATPGIRLETGTHVHVTARNPQSTISLGANGGSGVGGFPAGIGIATDGQLKEYIVGAADQAFKDTLTISVDKHAKWDCFTTREVIAHGDSQDTRYANQTTNITGNYTLTSGPRNETVKGDYTLNLGEHDFIVNGKKIQLTYQERKETFLGDEVKHTHGRETQINVGTKTTTYVGGWHSYYIGDKIEMTLAINLAAHLLKMERAQFTMTKSVLKLENTTNRIQQIGLDVDKKDAELTKAQMVMKSVGLFLLK